MKNKSLNKRILVPTLIMLLVVIGTLSGILYLYVSNIITVAADKAIENRLLSIAGILDAREGIKKRGLQKDLNTLYNFMQKDNYLSRDTLKIDIEAQNIIDYAAVNASTYDILIDDIGLYQNSDLATTFNRYAHNDFIIYSLNTEGYVAICSSFLDTETNRYNNLLLPKSLPLVKYTESNELFFGRIKMYGNWYKSSSRCLMSGNKKIGMLQLLYLEKDKDFLKDLTDLYVADPTDEIFIFDTELGYLSYSKGSDRTPVSELELHTFITSNGNKEGTFYATTNKNRKISYIYFKPYNAYVGIVSDTNKLYSDIFVLKIVMFCFFVVFIVFVILILKYNTKHPFDRIHVVSQAVKQLSEGKTINIINRGNYDDSGTVVEVINTLIKSNHTLIEFLKNIKDGNYNTPYSIKGEKDDIGKVLVEMQASLEKARKENEQRKNTEENQNWITKGLALFSTVLRQLSTDGHEKLFHNIMDNLIKYTDVNQGALYLIENNTEGITTINMVSCVAYNRHKLIKKTYKMKEGLIGRCIDEEATIYMTDIPDDYINITSGLGSAAPRNLLIVPLSINDVVVGAIELAAFEPIEHYKIEFVEKIAENIASTISTLQINNQTKLLLAKSQEQTEEMLEQENLNKEEIKQLKEDNKYLKQRENIATQFLNTINHSMIRGDLRIDGIIDYANTYFLDLLQMTSKEVRESDFMHIIGDKQKNDIAMEFKKIANGGTHFVGMIEFIKDNQRRAVLSTLTSIRDEQGKPIKILYLGIDISTIQKDLNEQIDEQKNYIAALENEVAIMVEVWNEQLNTIEKQKHKK